MQEKLGLLGFMNSGLSTGYFGDTSKNAVVAFQQRVGLKADGFVGPQTRTALNNATTDSLYGFGFAPVCLSPGWIVCARERTQHVWVLHDGVIQWQSAATFGGATPDGVFATQKGLWDMWYDPAGANAYSQAWKAPIPFMTNWGTEGDGTHYSSGVGPGQASHGCIRIGDMSVAAKIWFVDVAVGMRIFVYA